jgi:hypothetical protein
MFVGRRAPSGARALTPRAASWEDPPNLKGDAMPRENYAATVSEFRLLDDALDAHPADVPPEMDPGRRKLKEMTARAERLVAKRNALEAEKQAVTKELQELLEEGRRAAHFLRLGLKIHLGKDAEKLVAFGIRPFRSRKRSAAQPEPSA